MHAANDRAPLVTSQIIIDLIKYRLKLNRPADTRKGSAHVRSIDIRKYCCTYTARPCCRSIPTYRRRLVNELNKMTPDDQFVTALFGNKRSIVIDRPSYSNPLTGVGPAMKSYDRRSHITRSVYAAPRSRHRRRRPVNPTANSSFSYFDGTSARDSWRR
ncbi:hypothetical protein EVAR_38365_1 [Eumeta japonica]|uniref:Uncharacterized protein n=1 Tax=Eumeta variegata TaxID=151549 RepID=A0A4C1Y046_EUMVA|nr:hypothetical protein EVAR_38365_1 [Eumeta japonica]